MRWDGQWLLPSRKVSLSSTKSVLFLETSVALSKVFDNLRFKPKIDKFFGDVERTRVSPLVTPRIRIEVVKRIADVEEFLSEIAKTLFMHLLAQKGKTSADSSQAILIREDLEVIRSFFNAEISKYKVGTTEAERLQAAEASIVKWVEKKLKTTASHSISELFVEISTEISKWIGNKRALAYLLTINLVHVTIEESQILAVLSEVPGIRKKSDAAILAEIVEYKRKSDCKPILVTTDQADFLSNSSTILSALGIACEDPVYAISHLT